MNYNRIGKLSEGFQRFKTGIYPNYKCGFYNKHGQIAIAPQYTNVRDFSEGMAAVKPGHWAVGKWGYIDTTDKLVINCLFDKPRKFSDGYAKVVLNGEWCFINKEGKKIISLKQYNGGSSFHKGFAIVSKRIASSFQSYYGIIDKEGNEVVPCTVDCFKLHSFFNCNQLEDNVRLYHEGFYGKTNIMHKF